MRLKSIELSGFKSFARKTTLEFGAAVTAVVGPNGSGKSNVAESFRFVLGEQSMKSMRGKRGEDLIWNGSAVTPRAGRASVKLVFDNSDRALNLDFDEVTLERVVHRDGGNDYFLNGSIVRLRDISELLSQANIGASGHHIISQGEADRVLSAGVREREMLEDALGLTAYLYKREEAEKKLLKAGENMREVEALRRELGPHLKFLTAQVRKIEESHKLRDELVGMYQDYLKRESIYLKTQAETLASERSEPQREHERLDATIAHLREELEHAKGKNKGAHELIKLEEEGRAARGKRDTISRELGRVEGELRAHERLASQTHGSVPAAQAREFAEHIQSDIKEILTLEPQAVRSRLSALAIYATEFVRRITAASSTGHGSKEELAAQKSLLEKQLHELEREESRITSALATLRQTLENEKDASREAERELFQAMAKRSELESTLAILRGRADILVREEEEFKRVAGEAASLVGREVADFESYDVSAAEAGREPRGTQAERLRKLSRLTIKLEESGAGNAHEVMKEFNETNERDQFLARELADLELSVVKLRELIEELTRTLQTRFDEGLNKINKEFDAFFKLMFGGGQASLTLVKEAKARRLAQTEDENVEVDEDAEVEEGVDIAVSLPHKRIKGLHMLSGGERALTSIALIFAMSQVNPPPFLILDETEAALDEANSRRYGDMIETLAKHSQLIVITHNRETMSRASMLYGITMGNDGVSKLLSVKFEEAVAVAK